MRGLLDSGSSRTFVNAEGAQVLRDMGLESRASALKDIVVANSSTASISGRFDVPFKVDGLLRIVEVMVVPNLSSTLLLGMDFWRRFHLRPDFVDLTCEVGEVFFEEVPSEEECYVSRIDNASNDESVLNPKQRAELEELLQRYRPLFESEYLGCAKDIEHHIDTGDAPPFKADFNALNKALLHEIHAELDTRLRNKVVEGPVTSPYSSPILRVRKPDGSARWVVDLRKLNAQIRKPNAHLLPKINGMLMNVGGAAIISSLDIKDAYGQILLDKESRPKTAFHVPGRGTFQFTRMPAGLKDAAGRWQSYIEKVLGYNDNVLIYMDDILIWSKEGEWEHHKKLLREVLDKLIAAGITVNLAKSKFGRKETVYLGHVIDQYGVRPNPKSVAAVVNFPAPRNVRQVRQFLGLAGWMRKFVARFSQLARPLTDLTKKDAKFVWGEEQDRAFVKLKEKLCSDPVLKAPNFDLPFRVYTDGSAEGTGGILVQEIDGQEHPIAYTSRKLSSREEKNFSATELECLAVLHATEAFRPYLEGSRFEVVTDHAALSWLLKKESPKGRLARWAAELQALDFFVTHRSGSLMAAPDALSRNPVNVDLIEVPEETHDEWYKKLLREVAEKPAEYEQFVLKDGRLLKLISVGNDKPLRWVQCLPDGCREEALQQAHDEPTSGHGGNFKTLQRLRQRYYWPKMAADCKSFVKSCQRCQQVKSERFKPPGLMGSAPRVSRPFEVLCADLVGPLIRSSKQNTQLLVCVDFSKYTFLKPLRDATADKVCLYIENEIFLVYGAPRVIVVDNGPQFRSDLFVNMCRRYHVDVRSNIAYTPRNNPTERYNQTIETMVRCYVTDNQKTWDRELPKIQSAIRTGVSEVTGYTPQFLVYGSELILDGRLHRYDGQSPDLEVEERAEFVKERAGRERLFKEISERMKKAHDKNKRHYDLRRRVVTFPVGVTVWRKNFKLSDASKNYSAKLDVSWLGPYTVKRKVGDAYVLEDASGVETGPWHVEQLKRHVPRNRREAHA